MTVERNELKDEFDESVPGFRRATGFEKTLQVMKLPILLTDRLVNPDEAMHSARESIKSALWRNYFAPVKLR